MKPRALSTRERAIYDRLTLHARAALAPRLAVVARQLALEHTAPAHTAGREEVTARLSRAFGPGFTSSQDLPQEIASNVGGAL